MALVQLAVLALLVSMCHSQTIVPTLTSSIVAPSPMPLSDPPVPMEMNIVANRTYRDAVFYDTVYTSGRYANGSDERLARFNCHMRTENGTIINRVPSNRIFTVYFQIPVLHFLTFEYKRTLMMNLANATGIAPESICIDGYDQAFVGFYDEGVMLRIYDASSNRLEGLTMMSNFRTSVRDGRGYIFNFQGVWAFNYSHPMRGAAIGPTWGNERVSINIGGCRNMDRMKNFYGGYPTQNFTCRSLDDDTVDDFREDLAENPNPVNLYLEAGDIVFAIIGSICVAIVLGLAVTGYFIHPFFFD